MSWDSVISFERHVPVREEATVSTTLEQALAWWRETSNYEPIRVEARWAWMDGWRSFRSFATVRVIYLWPDEAARHEATLHERERREARSRLERRLAVITKEADLIRSQIAELG